MGQTCAGWSDDGDHSDGCPRSWHAEVERLRKADALVPLWMTEARDLRANVPPNERDGDRRFRCGLATGMERAAAQLSYALGDVVSGSGAPERCTNHATARLPDGAPGRTVAVAGGADPAGASGDGTRGRSGDGGGAEGGGGHGCARGAAGTEDAEVARLRRELADERTYCRAEETAADRARAALATVTAERDRLAKVVASLKSDRDEWLAMAARIRDAGGDPQRVEWCLRFAGLFGVLSELDAAAPPDPENV